MSASASYIPINVALTNITQAANASVTTASTNYYVVGQLVRFHIPTPYGMHEIDGQIGQITQINSTTNFTVNIDSRKFTAFNSSPTYPGNTLPQVSAIGDENNSSVNTSENAQTISGAFINNT